MRIQEAAQQVGCTQRAIKLYEEKGLLSPVSRSANGYRDYTPEDIGRLHEIQAYRKLGIGLSDIKSLLDSEDCAPILSGILARKREEATQYAREIEAIEAFLREPDAKALDQAIDYDSIEQAIRTQLPGFFGGYVARHFAPYLKIRITTPAQKEALNQVLAFWDRPDIKLPLLYRFSMLISSLMPHPPLSSEALDAQIQRMLHPTEDEYKRICEKTLATVRLRENPLVRYSPGECLKRSMMRSLRDCGYYDHFIPQMKRLSPAYCAYHEALTAVNERLCADLGLYYDSDFNLRRRKT